jgi:hypothetical protein
VSVATPTYERSAGRRRLAKQKKALPDGSFPIPNAEYLGKAIRAVGRAAPGKRPALAALIRKRAKQLGSAGAAKLKGSWADPKKNTKEMAQALYAQLIELNFTPADARASVSETLPFFTVELSVPVVGSTDGPQVTTPASSRVKKKTKKWDPDGDNDDDSSASGDTDKDMAGKLSPKARSAMKRMIAQGKSPSVAYKLACNIDKMGKKAA